MSDFGKGINVPSKDIVYRQDVEDMLQNALPSRGMWEIEGDVVKNTICETVADLMMDLGKLPSAEPDPEWRKKHYEMSYNQGFVDACKYYENLPERKKGKWIKDYCGNIICSECKGIRRDSRFGHVNFCNCCGAAMGLLEEEPNEI